jgi:hypothetical protein
LLLSCFSDFSAAAGGVGFRGCGSRFGVEGLRIQAREFFVMKHKKGIGCGVQPAS